MQRDLEAKKYILITSINPMNEALEQYALLSGWKLILVGDIKGPKEIEDERIIFLDIEKQGELGFSSYINCPENHYSRKNIGYLYAISHGAEIIAETLDCPFHAHPNLTERNYGVFENKTQEEVKHTHPSVLARYLIEKPFVLILEGESAIELEQRIHDLVWNQIPSKYPEIRHILFITHLNPVRALLRLLGVESWDIYFKKFSNASVTRLRTDFQSTEVIVSDYSCYNDPTCNDENTQEDMARLE